MRMFQVVTLVMTWAMLGCGAAVVPLPGTVFCSAAAVPPVDMALPSACSPCTVTFCNGAEGAQKFSYADDEDL